jgi:hypothetical protein
VLTHIKGRAGNRVFGADMTFFFHLHTARG